MKVLYVQMMDLYLIFQFVKERCHGNQNNVERNDKVMKADLSHLYSLPERLKTNWNITTCMCALTAAMVRLHLI